MGRERMMAVVIVLVTGMVTVVGCDRLRLAPGEAQKQNAYLHQRTVQAAEMRAAQEEASEPLQKLTRQARQQSEAIVAYYGMPQEIPASESIEDILGKDNQAITSQARSEALQRPDPWETADYLLELGIALAGVVGGVYGTRVVGGLQTARDKSRALREIVQANERFKQKNPLAVEDFKEAQQAQSDETRRLVAELK